MAYSSGTRNLVKLASAWAVMAAVGAFTFIHFDAIRDTLGLKLAPGDFGTLASQSEAAPVRPQDDTATHRLSGTVRLHAGRNGHFETTAYINYVKGHNAKDYFGIYDVVRMDTMWLDK